MEKENKFRFLLNLQNFAEDNPKKEEDNKDNGNEDKDDEEITKDDLDTDKDDEKNDPDEGEDSSTKSEKKQSQKENARQAELRRQREQEAREKKLKEEAYRKGKIDALKINEFTQKPINDEDDLYVYELQKKIKENGGDPINDLAEEFAKARREIKEQEAKKNEAEQKTKKDVKDFLDKYPKEGNILQDATFAKFANKRIGKDETLIEIYEDYLDFMESTKGLVEKELINKKQEEETKKKNNNPFSTNGSKKVPEKSYSNMNKDEKIQYLKGLGLI